ncbi:hypothetical protein, partial [Actinoplanes sp. NPDC026623]|uniref:hypothetical protein n=1 Tax=Actinoplanes sp. NPDC026623 TaxID=3155610 RepID=UPI0033CA7895
MTISDGADDPDGPVYVRRESRAPGEAGSSAAASADLAALKDFRPDYEAVVRAGLGGVRSAFMDARPDYETAGLGGVRSALMDARPHYEAVVSAGLGDVRSALKDF